MTVTTPAAVSDDEEEQKHDDEEIVVPPGDEEASSSASALAAGGRQQQHFGREFPRPFYDPITGEIMNDPMVGSNGDSYDRQSRHNIDATTGGSITWYPNRALQTIIQREVEMAAKDWKGSLRRFDDALQTGWNRLLDQSAFANGEYRPLPEGYYCPITCDLMTDPVITPDGISYERDAIENWVLVNGTSPVTRNALSPGDLRRNNNLYKLIQLEKDRTLESIHPSIRRWQESGEDTTRPDVVVPVQPTAPPAPTTQTTTTTSSYPTTPQQIEARRREQQQQDAQRRSLLCIFIFTAIVFILFIPYGGIFVFVLFITLCCITNSRNAEQRRQQQRR